MTEQKTILITGANGFTGRHAVDIFKNNGWQVVAVVRQNPKNKADVYACDLTNQKAVEQLIKQTQPDNILHLAGRNAVGDSWDIPLAFIETNVMGTLNVLEAARKIVPECQTLVVGSVLQYDPAKDDSPPHPYSLSKTMQTLVAKSWGDLLTQHVMIAKPVNLIGPGPSTGVCSILAKQVTDIEIGRRYPQIVLDNLSASRDFLDVRDAVNGYRLLFAKGQYGKSYVLGTGKSYTLKDIGETYQQLANQPFELYGKTDQPEPEVSFDTSAIHQLGWRPTYSLKESLRDILNDYRGQLFKANLTKPSD